MGAGKGEKAAEREEEGGMMAAKWGWNLRAA
jgi:hypothetical protein